MNTLNKRSLANGMLTKLTDINFKEDLIVHDTHGDYGYENSSKPYLIQLTHEFYKEKDAESIRQQILKAIKSYSELYPIKGGCTSLSVAQVMEMAEVKYAVDEIKGMMKTSEFKMSGEFAKLVNDKIMKLLDYKITERSSD